MQKEPKIKKKLNRYEGKGRGKIAERERKSERKSARQRSLLVVPLIREEQ